jgi:glycosyltransferase involved in cell wall biosynthesis
MKSKWSISIIYPVYNEATALKNVIVSSYNSLSRLFADFEIIIVNDGSTDGTAALAEQLTQKYPGVRVIHNKVNLGQGRSILKAFTAANKQLVLHNGIDLPFKLDDLIHLLPGMEYADIVVATRKSRAGYSVYRTIVSKINRLLIRTMFNMQLTDFNFVQLYKAPIVHEVKIVSHSTGFVIPELLIRAHDLGYKIAAVDIDYYPREQGRSINGRLKVLVASFTDLTKFWLRRRVERKSTSAAELAGVIRDKRTARHQSIKTK